MSSVYDLLRQRCGLSQQEAADLHQVRLDTIKSWCSDRRPAPAGAVDELRDLYAKILAAGAAHATELKKRKPTMDETGAAIFYLGEPLHERDARAHGWPCLGACMAAIGAAAAGLPRDIAVKLVPRSPGEIQIPRIDL